MKKSILLLCLCAVALVGLLILTKTIHDGMDSYVVSKSPTSATTPEELYSKDITDTIIEIPTEEEESETVTNPDGSTTTTQTDGTTVTTTPDGTTVTNKPDGTTVTTNPDGSSVTTTPDGTTTTTPPDEDSKTPTKPTPTTATTKPYGQQAPAVSFYDGNGNVYTLDAYKDKPIVLCFWASWAAPSESTLALLAEQYVNYSQDVYFIVICITDGEKETKETADAFLADKSYPFPVFYDLDGVCHSAYHVNTKPTTFFIKKDNVAYAYNKGALSRFALTTGIKYVLPPKES